MAQYKFVQIENPETCPIEELEKEVERLKNLGDFYETKQLALKKFINSVYGATASKYFIAHNTAVAESITLQGQDLNHFSENAVNAYFQGIFQADTELHAKLGITTEAAKSISIAKGKTTETGLLEGDEFSYLEGNQSLTVAGDTDSQIGDTQIVIDNNHISMEDFFTQCKYENNDIVLKTSNNSEIIPVHNHVTLTYIDHDNKTCERPVKYIMRHKVSKDKFCLTTKTGKKMIMTGDHSVMIIRNNELISIPARNILKTDKVITIASDKK